MSTSSIKRRSVDVKEMYCTCRTVVQIIKPIVFFLKLSLWSSSQLLKLPNKALDRHNKKGGIERSLAWPAPMLTFWNNRKRLNKKRVQLQQILLVHQQDNVSLFRNTDMIGVTSCEIALIVNSLMLTGCELERLCPKAGCFFCLFLVQLLLILQYHESISNKFLSPRGRIYQNLQIRFPRITHESISIWFMSLTLKNGKKRCLELRIHYQQ